MKVEFIEELDLSRVPKDIFDAFLDALEQVRTELDSCIINL